MVTQMNSKEIQRVISQYYSTLRNFNATSIKRMKSAHEEVLNKYSAIILNYRDKSHKNDLEVKRICRRFEVIHIDFQGDLIEGVKYGNNIRHACLAYIEEHVLMGTQYFNNNEFDYWRNVISTYAKSEEQIKEVQSIMLEQEVNKK